MNFSVGQGEKPLAFILNSQGMKANTLFFDPNGQYPSLKLKDGDYFPCFTTVEGFNIRAFISGKTGVGKSYLANLICKAIIAEKKDKKVYLVSPFAEDPSIDRDIKDKITRIAVGKAYSLDAFKNSILVFDDINGLKPYKRAAAFDLVRDAMQNGRKLGIDTIFINHTMRDNDNTKHVIQESNYFFFFPNSGNDAQFESFEKAYLKLGTPTRNKILMTENSRWVMIHNAYPVFILSQHEAFFPIRKELKEQKEPKRKREEEVGGKKKKRYDSD